MSKHTFVLVAFLGLISFSACSQNEKSKDEILKESTIENSDNQTQELHPYGGWYCPDNLNGFPPIDIKDLDQLDVVEGRLPTREETRNGVSLMYIEKDKAPNAKALDLDLPRLAKFYTHYSEKEELVIVIQAVTAGKDTVVGFRYVNGGNGSAWINKVTFLTKDEVDAMGPTPFVFFSSKIDAPKEEVWNTITKTSYAQQLGEKFNEEAFFASPWQKSSHVELNYGTVGEKAIGSVSLLYGNIYLQINYNYLGRDYVEKLLILDDEDGGSKLQFVAGPFTDDFEKSEASWNAWLKEVIKASEGS